MAAADWIVSSVVMLAWKTRWLPVKRIFDETWVPAEGTTARCTVFVARKVLARRFSDNSHDVFIKNYGFIPWPSSGASVVVDLGTCKYCLDRPFVGCTLSGATLAGESVPVDDRQLQ